MLDINECELGIGKCPPNKECKNIPGGYDCVDSKTNSIGCVIGIFLETVFGCWYAWCLFFEFWF